MNITQDILIKQIADREDVNAATVRQILKSAENIIFYYLSSTAPSEDINIKFMNGLHIKRKYVQEKKYSKGMFKDLDCPEHVTIKTYLSKYYSGQVNQELFGKNKGEI